ncbi:MAG: hypothetical protein NTZ14_13120 [Hyphomicrobiales bacterium]|nr:hypothetical protein [Hyphomicrobiales bacterium]
MVAGGVEHAVRLIADLQMPQRPAVLKREAWQLEDLCSGQDNVSLRCCCWCLCRRRMWCGAGHLGGQKHGAPGKFLFSSYDVVSLMDYDDGGRFFSAIF